MEMKAVGEENCGQGRAGSGEQVERMHWVVAVRREQVERI